MEKTESKTEWTLKKIIKFVFVWIGYISGGLTLLLYWFPPEPQLTFTQISNIELGTKGGEFKNIEISLGGHKLNENQIARSIVLEVKNTGSKDFSIGDFDQRKPWGIKVKSGELIDSRLISTNRSGLGDLLTVSPSKDGRIDFSNSIFNRGDWFKIAFLVIVKPMDRVELEPFSNIVGVDSPIYIESPKSDDAKSLISRALNGDWRIQAIRFLAYLAAMVGIIVVVVFTWITGWQLLLTGAFTEKGAINKHLIEFQKRLTHEEKNYPENRFVIKMFQSANNGRTLRQQFNHLQSRSFFRNDEWTANLVPSGIDILVGFDKQNDGYLPKENLSKLAKKAYDYMSNLALYG